MAYTVLARRYRSQTFDDVLGQDAAARTLRNAIAGGRVAHAYLFCGTRGCGKTTMARILAKSLNCLTADGPTAKPCLTCDSCIKINTGDDIDVIEIDGASNTGVDDIRQLRENASYRPARARFKIYIIDEVHMLSTPAFNALLKILEEPPEHVKFIFATTEPNKVLPTIQSRCQRFDFHNIPPEVISKQISKILDDEGVAYESDLLVHLSRLADGSMRDALSLLDQLISAAEQPLNARQLIDLIGIADRQKLTQLLAAIADHNAAAVLQSVDEMLATGQSPAQICEALIEMMREVMVYQYAGRDSALLTLTAQERADLTDLAEKFDIAGLVYNITALEKLHWTLKNSETSRALLEASLLRLALSEHFIGIDRLAEQIRALPAGAMDVKKKPLTGPVSNAAGNAVGRAGPTVDAAIGGGQMDAETLCRQWPQVAARVGKAAGGGLTMLLPQVTPVAGNAQSLELIFPDNGNGPMIRNICQERKAAIEKELSAIAAKPMRVVFGGPHGPAPAAGSAATAPSAKTPDAAPPGEPSAAPPAARPTRSQRNEVLNDPRVKMVLTGLNARLIDIQKADPPEVPADEVLTDPAESAE